MKCAGIIHRVCLLVIFASVLAAPNVDAQDHATIIGDWMGHLTVPNGSLRLVMHFTLGDAGTLSATLDSPDQGATGIPVDRVTFADGHLKLDLAAVGGGFEGDFNEQTDSIAGQWNQAGMTLPLVLGRIDEVPTLNRPQEPQPPFPYRAEEVSYPNAGDAITLAGTLTMPEKGGPYPAVILITGSGAQDRDETVFGHRPFLVLSDYLTRQGMAVLRVDDRGIGESTGDIESATSEDFASDVLAGIAYLKTRPEIDHTHMGLIGHSEGGIIAPMVAARSPEITFIVLMAGTGLDGESVLCLQDSLIASVSGVSDSAISAGLTEQRALFEILRRDTSSAVQATLHERIMDVYANDPAASQLDMSVIEKTVASQVQELTSPWFRYFLEYDPVPTLSQVTCPVLAIIGEKDLQVAPAENLAAIEQALKAGGNTHFEVKQLSGLNHLFQTAMTGSPDEYVSIEETMSPDALKLIGDWILAQTERKDR